MVVEAVDEAVVERAAVLLADDGVLRLADLETGRVVRGDVLDQAERVTAADLELSHVGDVEQAGVIADGPVFGEDAGGVLDRHLEARKGDELRAEPPVLLVEGRTLQVVGHRIPPDHSPMRRTRSAFCTCRRFSASSKTRDCTPSKTSSVTSSPR